MGERRDPGAEDGRGWVLGIEASNPSAGGASVGLWSEGGVFLEGIGGRGDGGGGGGRHDDDLMPAIDRLVGRSGVARGSIGRVAVSVGPGGFTGLRVACVTGQMLALALGASAVRVPTPVAVGVGLVERGVVEAGARLVVVLASKGDRAHATVLCAGEVLGVDEVRGAVMDAAEFAGLLGGSEAVVADRFLPPGFVAASEAAGVRVVPPAYDAGVVARLGGVLSALDAGALVPVYAREPEAVRLWAARRGER